MKNVEDIYPLSPVQQGMLFHALYAPKAGMYLEQKIFTLRGDLDVAAFQKTLERVVDRHPMLRTAFLWQGLEEPLQVVRRSVTLPWVEDDWRGLPPEAQQAHLAAFLEADRAKGMDPSKAPLMRMALFRIEDQRYQFIWTHHHILLDGWSMPLVFQEIFTLYEALRRGEDLELDRPRPYREFIAWLQRQDRSSAEAFWRRELRGFSAPTALPFARPADDALDGGRIFELQQRALSPSATESLRTFAQQHQLTVNSLVQGAWGLLLGYHSGQRDVVFGATVSGRPADLVGVESIVGLFINTLPVRIQTPPDAVVLPWLKSIQTRQVEMRQFEYSPLVDIQGWSDVPRGRPLFESFLVYENYPVDKTLTEQRGSLEIENLEVNERASYPLFVRAGLGSRLLLETVYDPQRFGAEDMRRLLGQMEILLEGMVRHPHARLSHLERMVAEETRREKVMQRKRRQQINLAQFRDVKPQAIDLAEVALVKTGYLNDDRYPLVVEPAVDDVDLVDWARENTPRIEAELSKHGAILFRGFRIESVAAFESFARAIRPELFDQYGDLPREQGKVYKSTPYPEDRPILFHNESSHMHRWPMKQWFCCVKAAREGGETPIVDCRKIYQRLDPRIVEDFRTKKLMYVRNFAEGLDVPWQEFFGTDDKSAVERYCRTNGIEFEWTASGGLRTRQICPGVARHPLTGEMVFFNQVQLHHVSCLDPELRESVRALFKPEDVPRNVYYGDGSPIEDAVIEEILRVYWDNCVSFPWQEGDILMVDNMITAHARNPFKGERKIVVALAEMISSAELPA